MEEEKVIFSFSCSLWFLSSSRGPQYGMGSWQIVIALSFNYSNARAERTDSQGFTKHKHTGDELSSDHINPCPLGSRCSEVGKPREPARL